MGALYHIPTATALVQTSVIPHVCHRHKREEGAVGMQGEDLGCALEAEQQDSLWKWVRQDRERGESRPLIPRKIPQAQHPDFEAEGPPGSGP